MSDPLEKTAVASRDVDRNIFENRVKPRITPETIAEHGANPFGPGHSPDLEVVLRYLRRDPMKHRPRYILVAAKPNGPYHVAEHSRVRGEQPTVTDESYASTAEAQHAIFLKRLRDLDDEDVQRAIEAAES
jgi:hypothetical protein